MAAAWGFDGHRRLASMMQEGLPQNHCLRGWIAARQTTALQNSACDPDRWRYPSAGALYDKDEWPRHYLEIDWVTPPSNYPRDWANAQILIPNYAVKNGRVPWHAEERYRLLVEAFRAGDTTEILKQMFWLSHYVTDAFSILHNTKDFDPNGLHQRWESDMLDVTAQINGIAQDAVGYYGTAGAADVKNNIFDVVLVGNGLVPGLIAADQANVGNMPGFYAAVREMTARRWGDAVTLLSSIIWTAWAEAGAPSLTGFANGCSMQKPTGEIVLKGYPVPGGFTHPDGGPSLAVDAGAMPPDASVGELDAGAPIPDAGGEVTLEEPPAPCGCNASSVGAGVLVWLAWLGARRWRRRLS